MPVPNIKIKFLVIVLTAVVVVPSAWAQSLDGDWIPSTLRPNEAIKDGFFEFYDKKYDDSSVYRFRGSEAIVIPDAYPPTVVFRKISNKGNSRWSCEYRQKREWVSCELHLLQERVMRLDYQYSAANKIRTMTLLYVKVNVQSSDNRVPAKQNLNPLDCNTDPSVFNSEDRKRWEAACKPKQKPPVTKAPSKPTTPDIDLNRPNCKADPRAFTAAERARWNAACGSQTAQQPEIDLNRPNCSANTRAFTTAEKQRWNDYCQPAQSSSYSTSSGGMMPVSQNGFGSGAHPAFNAIDDDWTDELSGWAVNNLKDGPLTQPVTLRGAAKQALINLIPESVRKFFDLKEVNWSPWAYVWKVPATVSRRLGRQFDQITPEKFLADDICEEFDFDKSIREWLTILTTRDPHRCD